MSKLNYLFQEWVVKKRYVFRTTTPPGESLAGPGDSYSLLVFNTPDDLSDELTSKTVREFLTNHHGRENCDIMFSDDSLICFLVYHQPTRQVAAVSWLICPQADTAGYWYDKIYFSRDECLLIRLFVVPQFRGRGLGRYLKHVRYHYVFKSNYIAAYAIVESYRRKAVHIQSQDSAISSTNYLVKLLKTNFLSIITGSNFSIWYVGPGVNRQWKLNR